MVRKASDNKYLHRHFHNLMNLGLEYLREHYGEEAVREYLRQFACAFYAPLKQRLIQCGLGELAEHFRKIYEAEEAAKDIALEYTPDELVVQIRRCPAIMQLRRTGEVPSPMFFETTLTVNRALCEGTPYAFELVYYDDAEGASTQRFYRKGV